MAHFKKSFNQSCNTCWHHLGLGFGCFKANVPSGHPSHVLVSWPPGHQIEHILKEALIKSRRLLDTTWDWDFKGCKAGVPSCHPSHVLGSWPPGHQTELGYLDCSASLEVPASGVEETKGCPQAGQKGKALGQACSTQEWKFQAQNQFLHCIFQGSIFWF